MRVILGEIAKLFHHLGPLVEGAVVIFEEGKSLPFRYHDAGGGFVSVEHIGESIPERGKLSKLSGLRAKIVWNRVPESGHRVPESGPIFKGSERAEFQKPFFCRV